MVNNSGTIFSPSVQKRPTTGSDDNQAGQSTFVQLISEIECICRDRRPLNKLTQILWLTSWSEYVIYFMNSELRGFLKLESRG